MLGRMRGNSRQGSLASFRAAITAICERPKFINPNPIEIIGERKNYSARYLDSYVTTCLMWHTRLLIT